jgi:hypothetical protein
MDDRFRQIIGRFKNKVSVDVDTSLNVGLETTTRLVKTNANPINSIIGQDDQFELERDESSLYRINGRLNIITANELTKGNDTYRSTVDEDWDPLFDVFESPIGSGTYVKTPNNWIQQICYPSDKDESFPVWDTNKPISFGLKVESLDTNNPSGNRGLLVVNTIQKHKLSEGDYIHINYINGDINYQGIHKVFELGHNGQDTETSVTLDTSFKGGNGTYGNMMYIKRVVNSSDNDAQYRNSDTINTFINSDITGGTNNTDYIKITTVNEHGLGVNDYVEIRKGGTSFIKGLHIVQSVIDNFNYTIKSNETIPSANGYTYRRMDGTPSDYYVRYFELLTGNDYEMYPASYGSSIYPETSYNEFGISNGTWLFHLNKDLNTGGLISHRNGIVNELQVCMLKRSGSLPYDWSDVTSHWDFNYRIANTTTGVPNGIDATRLELVSKNVNGGVGTIEKGLRRTLTTVGSKYIGDISEYNRKEVKERVITDVIFRFGIRSGIINNNNTLVAGTISENPDLIDGTETETTANSNLEGYYYKPFKKVEVRKFSNYIENADPEDNVVGIPADFELYSDGSMAWRDLLQDGFIEESTNGVDWPFLNGRHHIYLNHCVYVRRQSPYVVIDQSGIITINPKNAC